MTEHSKLPWDISKATRPRDGEFDYAIVCPNKQIIGECFGRTSKTNRPNARANAELIVRAVNSHEALVRALEGFIAETVDYMKINNLGDPERQHSVERARAALKLARGES